MADQAIQALASQIQGMQNSLEARLSKGEQSVQEGLKTIQGNVERLESRVGTELQRMDGTLATMQSSLLAQGERIDKVNADADKLNKLVADRFEEGDKKLSKELSTIGEAVERNRISLVNVEAKSASMEGTVNAVQEVVKRNVSDIQILGTEVQKLTVTVDGIQQGTSSSGSGSWEQVDDKMKEYDGKIEEMKKSFDERIRNAENAARVTAAAGQTYATLGGSSTYYPGGTGTGKDRNWERPLVIDKASIGIEKLSSERAKYRDWLLKFKNVMGALRPGSFAMFSKLELLPVHKPEPDKSEIESIFDETLGAQGRKYQEFTEDLYALLVDKTQGECLRELTKMDYMTNPEDRRD